MKSFKVILSIWENSLFMAGVWVWVVVVLLFWFFFFFWGGGGVGGEEERGGLSIRTHVRDQW